MAEQSTNIVKFYSQWVQNNFKTAQEGRPVGEAMDYIEIRAPGQDKTVVKRAVKTADQVEYAREFALYKAGEEQTHEGTPLVEWTALNQEDVTRLTSCHIYTIENLAGLSDAGLEELKMRFGPGLRDLQKRAKYYLEEAAPKSAVANLKARVDELTAKLERVELDNRRLEAKLTEATTPSNTPEPAADNRFVPESCEARHKVANQFDVVGTASGTIFATVMGKGRAQSIARGDEALPKAA